MYLNGNYVSGAYIPGTYSVEITAWADNEINTGESITMQVNVLNPCIEASLNEILMPESPLQL